MLTHNKESVPNNRKMAGDRKGGLETMKQNNDFLATEPIGTLLWKLSLPAIAAQVINLLYNLVDRIYIGHIPETGSLALTGLGVCMPIILIVSAFAALVSSGSAPRASMEMGKGNLDEAEYILGTSFVLQLMISFLLTIGLLLYNRPLLLMFGASADTLPFATAYMNIYALGTVFVQLTLGMNAFITAQGFATTGMLSVLIGAICNIILDPIFIYRLGMGVRGAALATILSQAVSTVWVLRFLTGKKTILSINRKHLGLKARIVGPSIALGLAPFIMQASESVILICFNSSLLRYGGDIAVGSMTILSSVMQFSLLPTQGLGQGAQPITSYNFGAGNAERVKQTFRLLLTCTLSYSMFIWLLVMLFPQLFARLFSDEQELIVFTSGALRIYGAAIGGFGAQIACQLTFTAIGKAKESIIVAVLRKFILLVPLIYLLPHCVDNPTFGVYLAEPVADFLSILFTVTLFAFRFRQAMRTLTSKTLVQEHSSC